MADEATSEEDMAAAMEAMADESAEGEMDMAAAMGEDGTLSQDEIDNLLGFDGGGGGATSGIQALLERSLQTYERLPMLEVVFDRFVRASSTSLRNFTSENVDVTIESMTSMRFEDYLNSVPLPALLAIFQAVEWENYGLITIDSALTYSMVDILLGGGRAHRPVRVEGRPFTTIEQDIVKSLSKLLLEDLAGAFNPLTPASFRLDRLETNPRFATITRPASAVIVTNLRIEMEERGGKAVILLPYATLDPVKDLLLQMFAGESFGSDVSWESHLTSEIRQTEIKVEATLPPKTLMLRELAALKVGSTILLDQSPEDTVDLTCRKIKMLSGTLGDAAGKLAISVTNVSERGIQKLL